jgi:hypothetical protein
MYRHQTFQLFVIIFLFLACSSSKNIVDPAIHLAVPEDDVEFIYAGGEFECYFPNYQGASAAAMQEMGIKLQAVSNVVIEYTNSSASDYYLTINPITEAFRRSDTESDLISNFMVIKVNRQELYDSVMEDIVRSMDVVEFVENRNEIENRIRDLIFISK